MNYPVSLLVTAMVVSTVVTSCQRPTRCVDGVEPGDTLNVTLLDVYDESSSYELNPGAFDIQTDTSACDFGHEFALGDTLSVHAGSWQEEDPCDFLNMGIQDTARLHFERLAGNSSYRDFGGAQLGLAQYPDAIVDGCKRSWNAYFYVRHDATALDPLVPGELPPAVLLRTVAATNASCGYVGEENTCVFVVRLEKQ